MYEDKWITCTPDEIQVRGYYFPWGPPKRIPYGRITDVERVRLGTFTGRWRIWGTGDLRHWANLDPGRRNKDRGLILDVGRRVRPVLTPDDVDAVAEIIAEQRGRGPY